MALNRQLAERVAAALLARGETVGLVEAAAGGRLSAALTAIPGSSRWFHGAAVAYSTVAKTELLGVPAAALASHGAVDDATALLLARAIRSRLGTTWGVAETGIAGPRAGRRSRKPTGLCVVAVAGPGGEQVRHLATGLDDRERNQDMFAEAAALALLAALERA